MVECWFSKPDVVGSSPIAYSVVVVKWLRRWIVIPVIAGSSPVDHLSIKALSSNGYESGFSLR